MRRPLLVLILVVVIGAGALWQVSRNGNGISEECDTRKVFAGTRDVQTLPALDSIAFGDLIPVERALALDGRTGGTELYGASKSGEVWSLESGSQDLVLDLSTEVATGYEQGLVGLAVSPDGQRLYVNYTDLENTIHVVEYRFTDGDLDESTRREVLTLEQPKIFHNGGGLTFTRDGLLWISTPETENWARKRTPLTTIREASCELIQSH